MRPISRSAARSRCFEAAVGLLCLPALSAALALPASGAEIEFDVRPSTTSAELGVPMTVSAVVRAPHDLEVLPDLAASTTDAYAIRGAKLLGETDAGAVKERRFELELLPLDVGKIDVRVFWAARRGAVEAGGRASRPPSGDAAADGRGAPTRTESPPFTVTVAEPDLGPEPQLKDIKALMSARPALWPWILAAALLAAAWWAWKRRKPHEAGAAAQGAPPDTRPPHVIAGEELDWLRSSGLWEDGRYKEFYVRLTDILRLYVERRYGLPAMKLTTTELSRGLRSLAAEARVISEVKALFDRADLAKFAKWKPEPGLGDKEIEAGREIVADSAPKGLAQGRQAPGAPASSLREGGLAS